MISCKDATYLVSKKEEKKLAFLEMIQLKIHLLICVFCRLFELQSKLIGKNAAHIHEHHHIHLPEVSKGKIIQALKESSN
ncbi:MAG TPA: hypothetical protein VHP12_03740 [Chitinophagaceae bacterium]|nr:hypothetical protein [Chitinophagaceae bacterium]